MCWSKTEISMRVVRRWIPGSEIGLVKDGVLLFVIHLKYLREWQVYTPWLSTFYHVSRDKMSEETDCDKNMYRDENWILMSFDVEGKHKCNVKVRSSLLFRPLILYSIFKFLKIYSIFTTFLWMDMWLIESKFAHKNFCRSIIFYLITLACLVKHGSHICNDRFLLFSVFQTFPVDKGSIVTKNY